MFTILTGSPLLLGCEALVLTFSALGLRISLFDFCWLFAMTGSDRGRDAPIRTYTFRRPPPHPFGGPAPPAGRPRTLAPAAGSLDHVRPREQPLRLNGGTDMTRTIFHAGAALLALTGCGGAGDADTAPTADAAAAADNTTATPTDRPRILLAANGIVPAAPARRRSRSAPTASTRSKR